MNFVYWKYEGHTRLREVLLEKPWKLTEAPGTGLGSEGGQPESWEDLQWELWEVMFEKKEGLEDRSTGKAGEEVRFG